MQLVNAKNSIIIFFSFFIVVSYAMESEQELKLSDYINLSDGKCLRLFSHEKEIELATCKKIVAKRSIRISVNDIFLGRNISEIKTRGITVLPDNLIAGIITAKLINENDTIAVLRFNCENSIVSVGLCMQDPETNFLEAKLFKNKEKEIIVKATICYQNKVYRELRKNCHFDKPETPDTLWKVLNQYNPSNP